MVQSIKRAYHIPLGVKMGNQVANQPKHISLLRSALKKVQQNPDLKFMFYIINNRAKKNALLHVDPKPGRSPNAVKNPASILKHLQTTVKDKFEDSFRTLLEIPSRSKKIEDNAIKKLTSCAGEVGMLGEKINFEVTVKAGKATEGDLRKVLNMAGLKKVIPGAVLINGEAIDEEEDSTESDVAGQLAVLKDRLSGATLAVEDFDNLLVELGLSLGDLIDCEEEPNPFAGPIAALDASFDDEVTFDERQASIDDFIAELSGGKSTAADPELDIMFERIKLEQRAAVLQERLTASNVTNRAALEEELAALDIELLHLSFGSPEDLGERVKSIAKPSRLKRRDAAPVKKTGVEEIDNFEEPVLPVDSDVSDENHPEGRDFKDGIHASSVESHQLEQIAEMTRENKVLVGSLIDDIHKVIGQDKATSKSNAKEEATIVQKAHRPQLLEEDPDHGIKNIRDTFRFKTVIDNFNDVPRIFQLLLDKNIGLVKIDTSKLFDLKAFGPWPFGSKGPEVQVLPPGSKPHL